MNWKKALFIILSILLLVSLIFNGILVYKLKQQSEPAVIEIVKNDTVIITKDSIITQYKYRTHYDTVFTTIYVDSNSLDTIKKEDTLHIPIDYKQASFKASKDSIDIEANIQYHGFKAEIDSVEFAYKLHYTQEVPKPKQKKFGWCITFGPSISYDITLDTQNKTFSYGPSVGVSVVIGPSYIIK